MWIFSRRAWDCGTVGLWDGDVGMWACVGLAQTLLHISNGKRWVVLPVFTVLYCMSCTCMSTG